MLKRTVSSVILILITISTIFLLPVWTFSIVTSIFIGVGLYEFFKLNIKNVFPRSFMYLGIFFGAFLPYGTYFCKPVGDIWEALFFVIVLIVLFLIQFTRKENQNAVTSIALTLFGIFYVGWFLTFLVKIRFLEDGYKLVAFLLLVTKVGDMGAYLIGSKWGRHPLIPRISPKKSLEGALGGFLFSIAVALISKIFLKQLSFSVILTSGILIGIFAQLGDLAESLIKRDFRVKDSSLFFPGLGGLLDVIDSILFTAPVFYIYITIVLFR